MKNFAALFGLVLGSIVGWLVGRVVDRFAAWMNQSQPDHLYSYVMAVAMATVFAFTFRHVVGNLRARQAMAEAEVDRAARKFESARVRSGKTPPTSFPAFQA